jgi:type IV secretion system protein VirB10
MKEMGRFCARAGAIVVTLAWTAAAAAQDQQAAPPSAPATGTSTVGSASTTAPQKVIYTVPAGTKILLQLRSAVNTKSAKPGDGVYLASTFPVVVGTRVMIPAGVYVQGVVDRVQRAGHVRGRAQLDMHFTSIIFPNGSVVEIPGLVNSLPGASKQKVKDDGEGTIEQQADKARNLGKIAEVTVPAGGTVAVIPLQGDSKAWARGWRLRGLHRSLREAPM